MISRTALRAAKAPSIIATRGFRASAARLSSPYHYPEGPRSNIPFNPLTKYFAFRFWGTMGELLSQGRAEVALLMEKQPFSLDYRSASQVGLNSCYMMATILT